MKGARERFRRVPIEGFSGAYRVSNLGRVQSRRVWGHKGKLGAWHDKEWHWVKGYYKVRMTDDAGREKSFFVHILILLAFKGPRPEGCRARFRDNDRNNLSLANLEWRPRMRQARKP